MPDSAKLYARRASLGVAELVVAVVKRETMVTPSIPKIRMTTMRYTRTLPLEAARA